MPSSPYGNSDDTPDPGTGPAAPGGPTMTGDDPDSGTGTGTGAQGDPTKTYVITLNRTIGADGQVTFSGTVKDPKTGLGVPGVTVAFGGALQSLQGVTVKTDANGNFTYTTTLKQDGTDSGTAEAWVDDGKGNELSNVAAVEVDTRY